MATPSIIPKNENIFCHNCGWSGKPLRWIKEVSNCSDTDVVNELKEYVPDAENVDLYPNYFL